MGGSVGHATLFSDVSGMIKNLEFTCIKNTESANVPPKTIIKMIIDRFAKK